jgi:hypothetical protein
MTFPPNMIKKELDSKGINMDRATTSKMQDAKKIVRNKFLAALMLTGANRDKYGELKCSIVENYVIGTTEYPERPKVVLRILSVYTPLPGWNRCIKQKGVVELKEQCLCNWTEMTQAAEESLNFNILLLKIRGNMTF